jgi:HEAT repeat protein
LLSGRLRIFEGFLECRNAWRARIVETGLSSIEFNVSNTVARLIRDLTDDSPTVRVAAARELKGLGESASSAVPALVAALSDAHWLVAATAASALGHIGTVADSAVHSLTGALGHPDGHVRRAAAKAVGNILEVDGHALKALEERSSSDTSPEVRDAAAAALEQCRAKFANSPTALYAPLLPPGTVRKLLS